MGWAAALTALAGLAGAHAGGDASARFAREALAALNLARAHPGAYAGELRGYRARFHDRLVGRPGEEDYLATEEGVAPVDSAIAFLDRAGTQGALGASAPLAAAATELARAQGQSGETGHGDAPLARHGAARRMAEVIAYGAVDGADAIRQLIVDDGVPSRDHRAILFDAGLRYAGAACGPHPAFGSVCVIELAATADGR